MPAWPVIPLWLYVGAGALLKFFEGIVARDASQRVFLRGWINKRIGNVPRAKCIRWDV